MCTGRAGAAGRGRKKRRGTSLGRRLLGAGPGRGPPVPRATLGGVPLLATLAGCSAAGDALAQRTAAGRALSGPVCTMLVGAAWANATAALPGGASVDLAELRAVQGALVAVSTPLLLMGANLRAIVAGAGPLLPGFAAASAGTLAGAGLGVLALGEPLRRALVGLLAATGGGASADVAADVAGVAAALAAKNVGGGFNFVAVADSASVSSATVALALAADNLAALLFFPLNSWLAGPAAEGSGPPSEPPSGAAAAEPRKAFGPEEMTLALAVSLAIVVAVAVSGAGGNTIAAASAVTVVLATVAPASFVPLQAPGYALARVFLGFFFASAGLAGGRVAGVDGGALLPVAALLAIIYGVHLAAVLGARKAFRMSALDAALVSNAAIGGPATAAALAQAKGTDPTPAVLVGNLGNAVATFAALAILPGLRALLGQGP